MIEPPSAAVVPADLGEQEVGAEELASSYEQEHAFVPEEDEHGYAAAEAGWDDEEAYGEEELAAGSEAPAPARRRRRWLVVAIAAVSVAVLAIAAAVFLLPSRTSAEPFRDLFQHRWGDPLHAQPSRELDAEGGKRQ